MPVGSCMASQIRDRPCPSDSAIDCRPRRAGGARPAASAGYFCRKPSPAAATCALQVGRVAGLQISDRCCHDQFTAPGLLITRFQGPLAQQVELILVQATLEPQQQAVIALPREIHRFLVHQHGIDYSAHLDQLLPVAAIAGKPAGASRIANKNCGKSPISWRWYLLRWRSLLRRKSATRSRSRLVGRFAGPRSCHN